MNDEVKSVLREFDANRVALAAEIVRLRKEVDDLAYECSRLPAARPPVVVPLMPPPERAPRWEWRADTPSRRP